MEGALFRPLSGGMIYSGANNNINNGGAKLYGCLESNLFLNNDHQKYYNYNKFRSKSRKYSPMVLRCDGANKDNFAVLEKDTIQDNCTNNNKKKDKKMTKKRSKLLKGLSRDIMSAAELLYNPSDPQGLQLQEASELLLSQLKHLKIEHKELKKKMKEDKAKLKAANCSSSSSSSSSSSESSDSEGEKKVIDMNRLKCEMLPQIPMAMLEKDAPAIGKYSMPKSEQDRDTNLLFLLNEKKAEEKRIEVCMGGKCKKSGGGELLEEFQRVVGFTAPEVDVIGCKCMGKCRDGPNVRLVSSSSSPSPAHSLTALDGNNNYENIAKLGNYIPKGPRASPPLCIGVGLEDVGIIVSKFAGEKFP